MQCIRPLKHGYNSLGKIVYSKSLHSNEFVGGAFPCRKCLPCRLNIAREKAIRCYHETKCHNDSIFLTLTYNNENLKSDRLQYLDFQLFMKSLRELVTRDIHDPDVRKSLYIPFMVTGEYGDKTKRPHWHAILFNYRPADAKFHYKTDRGDDVFTSATLDKLWKRGNLEFGSVTLDSANYVARYAAKKLGHGHDQNHNYHPIHKTSSRRAIGTSWIERNFQHTLENGHVTLPDGSPSKIPRFYLDWAKKHQPRLWEYYITTVAPRVQALATEAARKEEVEDLTNMLNAEPLCIPMKRARVKETILQSKFKQLQERLKL